MAVDAEGQRCDGTVVGSPCTAKHDRSCSDPARTLVSVAEEKSSRASRVRGGRPPGCGPGGAGCELHCPGCDAPTPPPPRRLTTPGEPRSGVSHGTAASRTRTGPSQPPVGVDLRWALWAQRSPPGCATPTQPGSYLWLAVWRWGRRPWWPQGECVVSPSTGEGERCPPPGPLSQQQGPAGCHQHLGGGTQFSWGTAVRAILTHSVWVGELPEPTFCPDPTYLVIGAEIKGSDILLVLLGVRVGAQGTMRTGCHPHRPLARSLPALTCSRLRHGPEATSKMLTLVPQTQKRCCPVWSSWGQGSASQREHPAAPCCRILPC